MATETTAEQMILDALAILQRGLPPGDLDDRQVVTELWGIFDNPAANAVIGRAASTRCSATLSPTLSPKTDRAPSIS